LLLTGYTKDKSPFLNQITVQADTNGMTCTLRMNELYASELAESANLPTRNTSMHPSPLLVGASPPARLDFQQGYATKGSSSTESTEADDLGKIFLGELNGNSFESALFQESTSSMMVQLTSGEGEQMNRQQPAQARSAAQFVASSTYPTHHEEKHTNGEGYASASAQDSNLTSSSTASSSTASSSSASSSSASTATNWLGGDDASSASNSLESSGAPQKKRRLHLKDPVARRQRQLERNRVCAKASRLRKKFFVSTLEVSYCCHAMRTFLCTNRLFSGKKQGA
jgi:hypothetical protein